MPARIQKWGNSLAVRIPKAFADEAGLSADSIVEIRLVGGQLVLIPFAPQRFKLGDLLAEVTDENVHHKVDFGSGVGNEAW